MKHVDISNVKEAGAGLAAGPYICVIKAVEDFPDKEYLKITYDIAEGEYANYYDNRRATYPDSTWIGAYVKSYKVKALPMFKRFCSAVSKSNGSFVFDGGAVNADEKTLVDKKIGLTFQEEEYYTNSGDLRTRLIVYSEFPIEKIGDQRTPKIRKILDGPEETRQSDGFMNVPAGSFDEVSFT